MTKKYCVDKINLAGGLVWGIVKKEEADSDL